MAIFGEWANARSGELSVCNGRYGSVALAILLDSDTPHLSTDKRMVDPIDPDLRRAAVALMSRGEYTPAEIAEALGLSRQIVGYWARAAGVNWKKVRTDRLVKALRKERRNGPRLVETEKPRRR